MGKGGNDSTRRVLMWLILGHVFLHSAMSGTRLAAPLLALTQGYSILACGVLVALFSVSQIFLALPIARLVDRHGLRLSVTCAAAVATVGIGLSAIWPMYPVLCISAICAGSATGTSVIALQRHAGRIVETPQELKRAFSWIAIAPSMSIFLGPLIAGLMIDRSDYSTAFLVLALLPIGSILCARVARKFPSDVVAKTRHGSAWSLWRSPEFRRLLMLNLFMTASWDLHSFMVPVLGHARDLSASAIGVLLGTFAIAATISRLTFSYTSRWLSEWMLIAGSLAAAGMLFGLYPFLEDKLFMAVCSFFLGFLLGGIQPTVMILLHHITPPQRHGEALAMRLMMINASGVAMPTLFGAATGLLGIVGVFCAVGLVVGVGGAMGLLLRQTESQKPPDAEH